MYINPTLFGAKISATERRVRYQCAAFSLSSRIMDEYGTVLVSQKRTSWWRLEFDVWTPLGTYRFYKRYLDYFLEQEGGVLFRTHGSADFYRSDMVRATALKRSSKLGKSWELDILTEDHKSALVLASVTMCKLNPTTY